MNGDHFAAHVLFADVAAFVVGISCACPLRDVIRKQSALEFPVEKALPGIARPERPIAIEHRELRLQPEYRLDKISRLQRAGRRHLCPSIFE